MKRKLLKRSKSAGANEVYSIAKMTFKDFCERLAPCAYLTTEKKCELIERYHNNRRLMRQELLRGLLGDAQRRLESIEEAQCESRSLNSDPQLLDDEDLAKPRSEIKVGPFKSSKAIDRRALAKMSEKQRTR